MNKRARYTAIGFVVSKLVLPIVRRQVKTVAKRQAAAAGTGAARTARSHPAKASLLVGTAIGALGWLLSRSARGHDAIKQDPSEHHQ